MTAPKAVTLQVIARPEELAAICRAADLLRAVAAEIAATPLTIQGASLASFDEIPHAPSPWILVTSLMNEAEAIEDPWAEVEARIRARYLALGEIADLTVYICTVFRHVPTSSDRRITIPRRVRIRRLNLLAAELSRETGAFVIDIDRAFADVGARTLETDFRLGGPKALEFAASTIAATVLATGLDDVISVEAQQRAGRLLAARMATDPAAARLGGWAAPPRDGRPTWVVQGAGGSGDRLVAAFVRQALAGKGSIRVAIRRFAHAVRRHGLGHSVRMVVAGVGNVVAESLRPAARRGR